MEPQTHESFIFLDFLLFPGLPAPLATTPSTKEVKSARQILR